MLAAAHPDSAAPRDPAPLAAVADDALAAVRASHPGRRLAVSVSIRPGLVARMPSAALRQVLCNLLDNAVVHGQADAPVALAGWRDDDHLIVTVTNETQRLNGFRLGELSEPFARADTSTTRECEGAGMGLYVVRRLVEHAGGSVSAQLDGSTLTVRLVLPVERRGVGAANAGATRVASA